MSCHGNVVRGTGTAGKHISNKVQPIPKHDDDNECKDRSPIQTPALSEKREKSYLYRPRDARERTIRTD